MCCLILKVPYYTVFHKYIIGLRYIQHMSLKCLAPNTKQIIAASHNPLCFSPVSKVLILWVFLNVEEGCSRATISRMLRHRVPPKDCSNVQDAWNPTEAGVLRLREISRLHMCILRGLKIPTMLCARTNFQNLWRKM